MAKKKKQKRQELILQHAIIFTLPFLVSPRITSEWSLNHIVLAWT